MEWDEIIHRSTPDGAVSALILDLVAWEKNLTALREFGISGDYAAVEEKLNALRSEFSQQFNTESKKYQ